MQRMTDISPQGRPAATVVIFRDRPDYAPDLLFMERSSGMAFAPGALVFPGGAIDPADFAHAESLDTDLPLDEAGARVGAIRETLEESGLAIGFDTHPDRFTLAEIRTAMTQGQPFAALLAEAGLTLDLNALVPFARWHPSPKDNAMRVFDTRFYLARLTEGSHAPSVDATENVHLFWSSAQEVLDRTARGIGRIIYPTRRNLERLALFDSFHSAIAHAQTMPVEKVTPWMEERDGETFLCIPDHLGYPVTAEPVATIIRG
jgi:8-oxo-dGTP pyrophosphatase MutT (NUDIX family)